MGYRRRCCCWCSPRAAWTASGSRLLRPQTSQPPALIHQLTPFMATNIHTIHYRGHGTGPRCLFYIPYFFPLEHSLYRRARTPKRYLKIFSEYVKYSWTHAARPPDVSATAEFYFYTGQFFRYTFAQLPNSHI